MTQFICHDHRLVWKKFDNKRYNCRFLFKHTELYKHQRKIVRSTLFKSCNYFFDNILNITKLSQKFGAYDVIISQSDAKQRNSRIMFSSKIKKAVIPSSTEHNEGLSLLIDQQFLGLFYLIQLLVFIINCQIVNAPY